MFGSFESMKKEKNIEKALPETVNQEEVFSEDDKEKELLASIEAEQKEAKEVFKDLIEMVSGRYEKLPEKTREDYVIHNEEILNNVIELGLKRGFSPDELKTLEISAILHDSAKAEQAPEKFKNVRNYTLVTHGEKAADESERILTDEYLSQHGFVGDFEKVRKSISAAIREHMGPHPGFMSKVLEDANEDLEKIGEKKIEHPKAQGKISEILLVADMAALANKKGIKKILSIREESESFQNVDLNTVATYKQNGINLKQGEAALLSAFKSAFQARDMIKNEDDGKWIEENIKQSLEESYSFGGEKVAIGEAFKKLRNFNDVMRAEEKLGRMKSQLSAYKY